MGLRGTKIKWKRLQGSKKVCDYCVSRSKIASRGWRWVTRRSCYILLPYVFSLWTKWSCQEYELLCIVTSVQIYGEHRHAHLIRSSFDVSHITALARSDFRYVDVNPDLIIEQRLLNGTHMSSVLYCSLGTDGFRCRRWQQRGGICCEQVLPLKFPTDEMR